MSSDRNLAVVVVVVVVFIFFFHTFVFFSIITEPISTNVSTKHPWVMGFKDYLIKGPRDCLREIITKKRKYFDETLYSSSPEFQPNMSQSILG